MMIASKGISKREQRSLRSAAEFLPFSSDAQKIVARVGLEEAGLPSTLRSLDDIPAGFIGRVVLRNTGSWERAIATEATLFKTQEGKLILAMGRRDEVPPTLGVDAIEIDAHGHGDSRETTSKPTLHSGERTYDDRYLSGSVSVADGELEVRLSAGTLSRSSPRPGDGHVNWAGTSTSFRGEVADSFDARRHSARLTRDVGGQAVDAGFVQVVDGKVYLDLHDDGWSAIQMPRGGRFRGHSGKIAATLSEDGHFRVTQKGTHGERDRISEGRVDAAMMAQIRPLIFPEE